MQAEGVARDDASDMACTAGALACLAQRLHAQARQVLALGLGRHEGVDRNVQGPAAMFIDSASFSTLCVHQQ